jgi:hypothetical protein
MPQIDYQGCCSETAGKVKNIAAKVYSIISSLAHSIYDNVGPLLIKLAKWVKKASSLALNAIKTFVVDTLGISMETINNILSIITLCGFSFFVFACLYLASNTDNKLFKIALITFCVLVAVTYNPVLGLFLCMVGVPLLFWNPVHIVSHEPSDPRPAQARTIFDDMAGKGRFDQGYDVLKTVQTFNAVGTASDRLTKFASSFVDWVSTIFLGYPYSLKDVHIQASQITDWIATSYVLEKKVNEDRDYTIAKQVGAHAAAGDKLLQSLIEYKTHPFITGFTARITSFKPLVSSANQLATKDPNRPECVTVMFYGAPGTLKDSALPTIVKLLNEAIGWTLLDNVEQYIHHVDPQSKFDGDGYYFNGQPRPVVVMNEVRQSTEKADDFDSIMTLIKWNNEPLPLNSSKIEEKSTIVTGAEFLFCTTNRPDLPTRDTSQMTDPMAYARRVLFCNVVSPPLNEMPKDGDIKLRYHLFEIVKDGHRLKYHGLTGMQAPHPLGGRATPAELESAISLRTLVDYLLQIRNGKKRSNFRSLNLDRKPAKEITPAPSGTFGKHIKPEGAFPSKAKDFVLKYKAKDLVDNHEEGDVRVYLNVTAHGKNVCCLMPLDPYEYECSFRNYQRALGMQLNDEDHFITSNHPLVCHVYDFHGGDFNWKYTLDGFRFSRIAMFVPEINLPPAFFSIFSVNEPLKLKTLKREHDETLAYAHRQQAIAEANIKGPEKDPEIREVERLVPNPVAEELVLPFDNSFFESAVVPVPAVLSPLVQFIEPQREESILLSSDSVSSEELFEADPEPVYKDLMAWKDDLSNLMIEVEERRLSPKFLEVRLEDVRMRCKMVSLPYISKHFCFDGSKHAQDIYDDILALVQSDDPEVLKEARALHATFSKPYSLPSFEAMLDVVHKKNIEPDADITLEGWSVTRPSKAYVFAGKLTSFRFKMRVLFTGYFFVDVTPVKTFYNAFSAKNEALKRVTSNDGRDLPVIPNVPLGSLRGFHYDREKVISAIAVGALVVSVFTTVLLSLLANPTFVNPQSESMPRARKGFYINKRRIARSSVHHEGRVAHQSSVASSMKTMTKVIGKIRLDIKRGDHEIFTECYCIFYDSWTIGFPRHIMTQDPGHFASEEDVCKVRKATITTLLHKGEVMVYEPSVKDFVVHEELDFVTLKIKKPLRGITNNAELFFKGQLPASANLGLCYENDTGFAYAPTSGYSIMSNSDALDIVTYSPHPTRNGSCGLPYIVLSPDERIAGKILGFHRGTTTTNASEKRVTPLTTDLWVDMQSFYGGKQDIAHECITSNPNLKIVGQLSVMDTNYSRRKNLLHPAPYQDFADFLDAPVAKFPSLVEDTSFLDGKKLEREEL